MNPVAFTIGSFEIKWYSIFILAAILICYILINGEAKKFNIKKEFITNLLFWAIIVGIIGARLYYCMFNYEYYSKHLVEILYVWEGGLAIHGGIIFGGIASIIYCKKYGVSVYRMFGKRVGRDFRNHQCLGHLGKLVEQVYDFAKGCLVGDRTIAVLAFF